MPWYVYNYPGDPCDPNSYLLSIGIPICTGDTLCAIYAQSSGSIPSKPKITDEVCAAIRKAINGEITSGVTALRPSP